MRLRNVFIVIIFCALAVQITLTVILALKSEKLTSELPMDGGLWVGSNEDPIEPAQIPVSNIVEENDIEPIDELEESESPEFLAEPLEQKIEGPYPEKGYNSSLGLGGNLGSGGGAGGAAGGGHGGFHYRRARKSGSDSGEVYRSPYPGDDNTENTEKYSDYSINKFVHTADSVFSTFAIDVDTASYTVMRSKIKSGQLPSESSVRVAEYINYFDYMYPAPTTGLFTVHSQIADNPFNIGETKLLRVALRTKDISNTERRTAHLTFLIDVSGSMNNAKKLPLVKQTLKTLINNLRTDDTIAICTYASHTARILEPTAVADKEQILAAIEPLTAGGSTFGEAGLKNAYELADSAFVKGDINRIILCTDGDFNVGNTEGKSLAEAVNHHARKGITMTAVGYGMGNYKDNTLESIANAGNGNYFYIDSTDEIKKVFGENLVSTLDVVAADVKFQLEFNPNFVREFRLVGYETRALTTEQFRDDIVDAGEVGAGHAVTAIYELVMAAPMDNALKVPDDLAGFAAMYRIRYKENITDEKAYEVNFGIENKIMRFDSVEQSMKFAVGVMGFADILRKSPFADGWKINTAIDCCEAGYTKSKKNAEELIELMRKAISLRDQ